MKQTNHKQNIKKQRGWRVGGAQVACVLVADLDTIKMVTRALPVLYVKSSKINIKGFKFDSRSFNRNKYFQYTRNEHNNINA